MRLRAVGGFVIAVIACGSWSVQSRQAPQPRQPGDVTPAPVNEHRATKEEVERWMKELSNWGRWGKDDQLGALNLITPAKREEAAKLVKAGTTVSMSRDLPKKSATAPNAFAINMTITSDAGQPGGVATDRQDIDFHGGTITHLDALCHVSYGGAIYNGFSFTEMVTKEGGCEKLGVTAMKEGLVTRGVLLDIPRLKGIPYLAPNTHVYREDIEAWERQAGVRVSPGDAIFLRTGRWLTQAKLGPGVPRAGFDASVIPFLKERDVALVASDWTQDVGNLPGFLRPIHRFAIVALGAPLIDNADLEGVAELAAKLKRWEFMLVATPPRVPNATGSPINPVAVF